MVQTHTISKPLRREEYERVAPLDLTDGRASFWRDTADPFGV